MGEFQQQLEEYIESHSQDWKDNVIQQSRSWLKQGLNDRAATRDMKWGIPVPAANAEGKSDLCLVRSSTWLYICH